MPLTVNGIPLDEKEVVEEMARLKPKHDEVFKSVSEDEREEQLRAWARENIIERILLNQAAEGYRKEHSGETLEESFRSLVDSVTRDVPPIAEGELRRRYEADPSRFTTPDIARAGRIVLLVDSWRTRDEALEGIREIKNMLNEGRDFEDLAASFSDCPENDGDLGWFPRGKEFDSAVFTMAAGEVSDIIETPHSFRITKLYEKRAGSVLSFEAVRDILSAERVQEIKGELLEKFVDSLRASATIVEKA